MKSHQGLAEDAPGMAAYCDQNIKPGKYGRAIQACPNTEEGALEELLAQESSPSALAALGRQAALSTQWTAKKAPRRPA
jgi:hypothetical protein